MYSMSRSTCPPARANSTRSSNPSSLTPRRRTVLSLIGPSPASYAAAMPERTRCSGTLVSPSSAKTAGSSESSDTVTRLSPASARPAARSVSSEPLVVSAMSSMPGVWATWRTSTSRSRRSSGSPPVRRTLVTPSSAKTRISRPSSSKLSSSERGRKAWSGPNSSRGMQYGQRKLQRSVTETRRSRRGRASRSSAAGRGSEAGVRGVIGFDGSPPSVASTDLPRLRPTHQVIIRSCGRPRPAGWTGEPLRLPLCDVRHTFVLWSRS